MSTLVQDFRFAVRRLFATPGVTLAVLLSLSLAIGANGALVGALRSTLFAPLPYHSPDRMVFISATFPERGGGSYSNSYPNYLDFLSVPSLDDAVAHQGVSFTLSGAFEPERVVGLATTANLFQVLAVDPVLGRAFVEGEDGAGGARVAVLSHGIWEERFHASRDALGKTLTLDGEPYTIVGIMPRGFFYPTEETQVWTTLLRDETNWNRFSGGLQVVGRIASGADLEAVREQTGAVAGRIASDYPGTWLEGMSTLVRTVPETIYGEELELRLYALWGAVGLLLFIACINTANLLLARGTSRRREVAVRAALGAGRRRIASLFLAESIALGIMSGLLGVAVAWAGMRLLRWATLAEVARAGDLELDPWIMLFTVTLGTLSGLLFGGYPALRASRPGIARAIQEGGRGRTESAGGRRSQRVLVGAQVALTLVVLVGAGLMMRTMQRLDQVDPGFRTEGVLAFSLYLTAEYDESGTISAFQDQVLTRLQGLPGVASAGAVQTLPLGGVVNEWTFWIEEDPEPGAVRHSTGANVASPGYFRTMGIPLKAGRYFRAQDRAAQGPVVVVSEAMARDTWPGQDPLGKRLALPGETRAGEPTWRRVVGVVGDVRHRGLRDEARGEMYLPFAQMTFPTRRLNFVLGTAGPAGPLAPAAREAVLATDPAQAVYDVMTLEDRIDQGLESTAGLTWLLGFFGLSALLLSSLGIFGVVSYSVSQRRHEMGIRVALGAERRELTAMVVRQGLVPVGTGILLGGLVAGLSVGMLADLLYGVEPLDPATFLTVPALLLAVALVAVYPPARRAVGGEPLETLSSD